MHKKRKFISLLLRELLKSRIETIISPAHCAGKVHLFFNFSTTLLVIQTFLLTACFYSMNGCNSGGVKSKVKPALEADYLVLNEKILLNFFGSPEEKEWAIKTLEDRCEEQRDPHACYNLATHLFSNKNFVGAIKFAEKSILLNPNDTLYFELYRQSLIENGKMESANKKVFPVTNASYLLTKLENDCRNKKSEIVYETVLELTTKNILSLESIQNGFLKECLTDKMLLDIKSKAKRNKINFSNYYYAEKNKSNLFFSVWDTSYLTKNQPIENESELKNKLTNIWKEFRKAVASKNDKLAKKTFKEFIQELKIEKTNSKQESNLYLAIERAAKLLIEQDEFFAKYKSLSNEF